MMKFMRFFLMSENLTWLCIVKRCPLVGLRRTLTYDTNMTKTWEWNMRCCNDITLFCSFVKKTEKGFHRRFCCRIKTNRHLWMIKLYRTDVDQIAIDNHLLAMAFNHIRCMAFCVTIA